MSWSVFGLQVLIHVNDSSERQSNLGTGWILQSPIFRKPRIESFHRVIKKHIWERVELTEGWSSEFYPQGVLSCKERPQTCRTKRQSQVKMEWDMTYLLTVISYLTKGKKTSSRIFLLLKKADNVAQLMVRLSCDSDGV